MAAFLLCISSTDADCRYAAGLSVQEAYAKMEEQLAPGETLQAARFTVGLQIMHQVIQVSSPCHNNTCWQVCPAYLCCLL